jgi:MYXO-CTERM domain-containing protein
MAATNARLSSSPNGAAYRMLNPARPSEYFLWSNLQNQDEWAPIAGSGLLVWHFDKSINGNAPPEPLQVAVVQAGGNRQLSATDWPMPGSAASDLFGKNGKAELGAQTMPNTSWNNGSPSGLRIYDISAPGPAMQFSVGTGPLPPNGGGTGGSASIGGGGVGGSGGSTGGLAAGGVDAGQAGNAAGASMAGSGHLAGAGAGGSPLADAGGAGSGNATAGQMSQATPTRSLVADEAGCGCRSTRHDPSERSALWGSLVAALVVARRRRAKTATG